MQYYNIKYVSIVTGINPHKIRKWEERYGVIEIKRDKSNIRIYTDKDINRLEMITFLIEKGQRVSLLANLSDDEMAKQVSRVKNKMDTNVGD